MPDGGPRPERAARPRLLVVDDEPLNRDLLRRALHAQYLVEEAEDADTAAGILAADGPPVLAVLCDQLMPGRSGTELAAEVRAKWPSTRFLLLTGYDDDPDVQRAHREGLVDQVVTKPWSSRALKQLLTNLFADSPRR